jgi:aromatic-L-amino-acid decarboxylase
VHHLTSLPDQRVGRRASRAELETLLREPAPEQGAPFDKVLAEFGAKVAPFAFRINHPRFLAFIPGAPTLPSVLGDWLCSATNFFAGVWLEAAGPAQVELIVLDWFKEFLGYPARASGLLTSGGSEANLTALVVARQTIAFADRERAVLYVTDQRHWSVDRAARIIGLHPDQVRPLPATGDFRLDPEALAQAVERDRRANLVPWVVVANAGATNTGAVDPLSELAQVCRDQRLWFHVDAAYGWPAVLTVEGRADLAGIEQADSLTLDPHKWFGQTFEAGCLLVRDGKLLAETFALRPEYMQDVAPAADEVNFCDHGLALTRRFRALKIWLSVKVLGVAWFRGLIEHSCRLADYAQALLERAGVFEILSSRQLSIVAFRLVPRGPALDDERLNRLNLRLQQELGESGRAFLSSTRLSGRVALRFCFVNWRTSAADVDAVVQQLIEIGATLDH